jgi:hypothetical protein
MHLKYISRGALVIVAGGNPWKVNATLQSGRPAQISDLAQAFHDAGQSTTDAETAFRQARDRFEKAWTHEDGGNPINDSAEVERASKTLGLQAAQLPEIGAGLENVAAGLAEAQRSGKNEISTLEGKLQSLDDELGVVDELEKHFRWGTPQRWAFEEYTARIEDRALQETKKSLSTLTHIRDQYSERLRLSMNNLRKQGGYDPVLIQGVDGHEPETPGQDKRRVNQIDAFKQVFGREPTSDADWATAAALDPHTYNPDFGGQESRVEVVKISPVPGQGVVRVSQWIPQRDVWNLPPTRDLGNNRLEQPFFDPENTKVTAYIDYENGLVVLRQNPSVEQTRTGGPGEVRVKAPSGSVTQLSDGSVRIKYDAGNPFAPAFTADPNGLLAGHTETVNGDLVFTPGPGGVQVNGTRTDYPSLEVYQDLPNAGTHTVLIDPAQSGSSEGPGLNLPWHHDVGPLGGKAFAPFDHGGWNLTYDVPAPLPSTEFGPVTNPPSVPSLRAQS